MEEDELSIEADSDTELWRAALVEHLGHASSVIMLSGEEGSDLLRLETYVGQGKTWAGLEAAKWLSGVWRAEQRATLPHAPVALLDFGVACVWNDGDNARARLRSAVENLRAASTVAERRTAARDFLSALAELIGCLLCFLVRVLILLLSRLLGRTAADDMPVWKPEPIDTSPQITPRGPNDAFPVYTHRGGFHRSALGSAVLAA
ncbi:hypothetical protein [Streptomyces sp. NPDC058731]|uniref:hypothetical protein n=1 Tax=Streptomyces sp. NPDC058731 TaxID=3346613 RepID=UPI00367E213A